MKINLKKWGVMVVWLALLVPSSASALGKGVDMNKDTKSSGITINRTGTQASVIGPSDWFTGSVRIDPLFNPPEPARAFGASVTFEPGARTAWHTHPLGQTLIVTSGSGLVQHEGGPIEEIRSGDVVWIPPGVKHWHGASPSTFMTHIAIQEQLDGKAADWMEHVSNDQYPKAKKAK